jgi:predicted RecA/RadA family phage recombinase
MRNYVQDGDRLQYANASGSTITSGSPVKVGTKVGIAVGDIPNNTTGVLAMEYVFTCTKATTDVIAQGAIVYWDDTAKKMTVTATSNNIAGYAQAAAGNGATTVDLMLNR